MWLRDLILPMAVLWPLEHKLSDIFKKLIISNFCGDNLQNMNQVQTESCSRLHVLWHCVWKRNMRWVATFSLLCFAALKAGLYLQHSSWVHLSVWPVFLCKGLWSVREEEGECRELCVKKQIRNYFFLLYTLVLFPLFHGSTKLKWRL